MCKCETAFSVVADKIKHFLTVDLTGRRRNEARMLYYFRTISTKRRTPDSDRHLAYFLTFVAGAANAGGFMSVRQYTSHMSGIVSSMADNFVLGNSGLFVAGLAAVVSFIAGAATSAILVNWGRRLDLNSEYALPLLLEAMLLLVFGIFGSHLQSQVWFFISFTVLLLCFIMGLQNAIITKLSQSRIRTTHVTGLITDFGIELGKLFYWNDPSNANLLQKVTADRTKLRLLGSLVSLFFLGGILGAFAFQKFGFIAAVCLGVLVFILAIVPVIDDIKTRILKING
jgi:uncharacterized membrane protein YoaK (UPF0700 family)